MAKVEDIPGWAQDEADTKKKEETPVEETDIEGEDTEEVLEDDKDHGIGPFVEGLYNATEETDDDEEEESEDDPEEDESEDEDAEESEDGEDEEESAVVEVDDDDNLPPSKDSATLDDIAGKDEGKKDESGEDSESGKEEGENADKGTGTPDDGKKGRKMRSKKERKPSKFNVWLNGTPEHPLPLFSLRAKFKRWRLIKFHNHVWLRIMSYDKTHNEYVMCENLIPRSKLPKTAVHCTGEKNVYFDKLFEVPYEPWKDNGFGAMNAYLYMKDTSIDEALLLLWQGPKMSMRTLMIIGIIAVAVMFYLFYMMQG